MSNNTTGDDEAMASAPDGSGSRARTGSAARGVVLVVDDFEDNRELYAHVLRREGYEVAVAGDGADALEIAARVAPVLVLMDLAMPVMDGWEATRRLKSNPALAAIPVLALSAFTDAASKASALEAGCSEYLSKPCAPAVLTRRVREAISRHHARLEKGPPAGSRDDG